MPEEVQDTEEESSALATEEETQEETAVVDDTEQTEELGFNKTQLHQISSALGRIVKNQFEENYAPAQQQQDVSQTQNSAIEQFEQDIQDDLFGGKTVSAIRKVMNVVKNAETNLTSTQKVATDKALTEFSEDPEYKDCFTNAQKIAHKAISEGMPPDAAARLGFYEAKANHLVPDKGATDLGMLRSGKRTTTTTKPKLPAQFKKQAEKDIADGHYKDVAEYIEALDPSIRAKYDI
jgi:hypothetical protein